MNLMLFIKISCRTFAVQQGGISALVPEFFEHPIAVGLFSLIFSKTNI